MANTIVWSPACVTGLAPGSASVTYSCYAAATEGANGNTISMFCGGYRYCDGSTGHPSSTEGWYWTSTSSDEDKAYAAFFKHYDTYDNITTDEMPKCQGFSVHLIYPVAPELW